jgi:hypothetical protein
MGGDHQPRPRQLSVGLAVRVVHPDVVTLDMEPEQDQGGL